MPEPGSRRTPGGALVICAAWLLAGFVGASAVAAGLLRLLDGGGRLLPAVILALCGVALATTSWRHGRAVVGRANRAKAIVDGSPARSAGAR